MTEIESLWQKQKFCDIIRKSVIETESLWQQKKVFF